MTRLRSTIARASSGHATPSWKQATTPWPPSRRAARN